MIAPEAKRLEGFFFDSCPLNGACVPAVNSVGRMGVALPKSVVAVFESAGGPNCGFRSFRVVEGRRKRRPASGVKHERIRASSTQQESVVLEFLRSLGRLRGDVVGDGGDLRGGPGCLMGRRRSERVNSWRMNFLNSALSRKLTML